MTDQSVSTRLTDAELLKFDLLADGLDISDAAARYIAAENGDRPMTPADYASTSGVILRLEGEVWVNAPIAEYNSNFVSSSMLRLDADSDGLVVIGPDRSSRAEFWLPPQFHGQHNADGEAYNSYGFAHTDRIRISPIEGCAFTCKFCDLPYEFRYRNKHLAGLLDTVRVALDDPIQPVGHILISGGTPRPEDYQYVRDVYQAVTTAFPEIPVDIMMVPIADVMDPAWLADIGVNEVSVNLEVWSNPVARMLMPRKHKQGREFYLDYLENAAKIFGGHRVRSMLMLGLEPLDETLAGVEAIAARGATPVLSPFRPDPSTPLRNQPVPTAQFMLEAYLSAREITKQYGVALGPSCIPCAHNTLTLPTFAGNGDAGVSYAEPHVI